MSLLVIFTFPFVGFGPKWRCLDAFSEDGHFFCVVFVCVDYLLDPTVHSLIKDSRCRSITGLSWWRVIEQTNDVNIFPQRKIS